MTTSRTCLAAILLFAASLASAQNKTAAPAAPAPTTQNVNVSNVTSTAPMPVSVPANATLPVSAPTALPVTIGNAAVPVSGTVNIGSGPAVQEVSGSVAVTTLPAIQVTPAASNTELILAPPMGTVPVYSRVTLGDIDVTSYSKFSLIANCSGGALSIWLNVMEDGAYSVQYDRFDCTAASPTDGSMLVNKVYEAPAQVLRIGVDSRSATQGNYYLRVYARK